MHFLLIPRLLAADNTYTGGTTITAGTLQLGNGGTTGGIVGDVTDNGTLTFNRSDAVTFAGVISGMGAVNQIGSGTTILTVDSPYTGGTTVNGGTLVVGDFADPTAALSGDGPISVRSGATLGGYGSVTGDVTNSGVIAPGSARSILGFAMGAFTIKGNYVGSGGTLAARGQRAALRPIDHQRGSARGNTMVRVTNVGGLGAETTGNGIEVVNAVSAATTAPEFGRLPGRHRSSARIADRRPV